MSHEFLQNIWFVLIGVLLTGYAILDGFDLGVGVLLPRVARTAREREQVLATIGPFWDGNEVWLLAAGGALFAAFPHVYATVFSGFYLALMLVLFALIFRAAAFEFRHRVASPRWHAFWDGVLFVGSLLPAVLTGVAVGNIIRGVPLTADLEYAGSFLDLLNPFALVVGLAGLAMFVTQGAVYLWVKTDGPVAARAAQAARYGWLALVILWATASLLAFSADRGRLSATPWPVWMAAAFTVISLTLTRHALSAQRPGRAFLFSSLTIAGLMAVAGLSVYPYLLPASNAVQLGGYQGLSIYNASASPLTLTVMLVIALIGMPLVIAYTAYVYRIFRGKFSADEGAYSSNVD